jgi:hypothetical protein
MDNRCKNCGAHIQEGMEMCMYCEPTIDELLEFYTPQEISDKQYNGSIDTDYFI